jgi:predicted enzyme related to lactoylglutathione lyase
MTKKQKTFQSDVGAIAFFEFYSNDTLASKKFLENVFGWQMAKSNVGGVDIWTFDAGNGPEGHMMAPMGLAPGTVAFVKVKSVDDVIRKIPKYGGKILVPKFEVPGLGWFTYFEAPGGTVHAAYQQKVTRRK